MALMGSTAGFGATNPGADDSEYDAAVKSGDIRNVMAVLEKEYRLPAGYLAKTAQVESRMNPSAQNPNSSAGGLFQFINSTAKRYGLTDKMDPVQSTLAAAQLAGDNADYLSGRLGRDPTTPELYAAHQQGAAGAAKILAQPNAMMADLVGGRAAGLNGAGNLTGGQFIDRFARKLGMNSPSTTVSTAPTPTFSEDDPTTTGSIGLMNKPPAAKEDEYPLLNGNMRDIIMAMGMSMMGGKKGDYFGRVPESYQALQAMSAKAADRKYDMYKDNRDFGFRQGESQRAQANTDRSFGLQATSNDLAQKRESRADELERERVDLARRADVRAEAAVDTPEKRKAKADEYGLTGNARVKYLMTGKYESDEPKLTVFDRKAISDADTAIESSKGVLGNINEAKELSRKAYEGPLAGVRGTVSGLLGSEAGRATTQYDNLVTTNTLANLKQVFGGNPTEGERKILLDVQGSSSQPDAVRQKILDRAYAAAERRIAFNEERAKELRGGSYYQPGGGEVRGTAPARAPTQGAAVTPPDGAIAKLRANPSLSADFDAKFGPGSAARILGAQ